MRYLIVCFALFFSLSTEAQQVPTGRRKHAMSRAFTEFTGENCFQITRQEADQAYRERSWDDAAALYRAAKSCADADQAGRSDMNLRIRACRDAAEQELLDKERDARRQARQAIASNRADDAQELLKNFDRGLAYRLADFANQYIAPEGEYNADCLQAMYDSWYYIPQVHSNLTQGYDSLRIPLCYQLPEDGSTDGIIQFGGQANNVKLYKLSPSNHVFHVWDGQTLRPEKPLVVDTAFTNYQLSPDGHTLVFQGKGFFAFWQNGREIFRQKVSQVKASAFSPKSETFYYYDPEEKKIMALDLRLRYVTQSRKSNSNVNVFKPPVPLPIASGLEEEPAAFAIRPSTLWLGYLDSVVVCTKKGNGGPWQRSRVITFARQIGGRDYRNTIRLFPEKEAALVTSADTTNYYELPTKAGRYSAVQPKMDFEQQLLGVSSDGGLVAKITPSYDGRGNQLYMLNPAADTFYYGAFAQPGDYFNPWQGAFSPDGHWFAASNGEGLVKLWALADRQSERLVNYGELQGVARLSPDGQKTIMETDGKIESYSIASRSAEWALEIPDKNLGELVVANGWQAYYAGADSLVVLGPRRRTLVFSGDENRMPGTLLVAFDPGAQFVAYAPTSDSIVVRSLPGGELVSRRAFSGSLRSLTFVPERHALVVVTQNTTDFQQQQNVIKIWDFAVPSAPLSTVRLHDYAIQLVAVSPLGDHVAFSDGNTIRVFDLDHLDDEQASIRALSNFSINSLTFQPNGGALVAGYNNGNIIFWNAENAQFVFQFKNGLQSWTNSISQMAFSPTGNRLRYLDFENNLFERQLDPDTIRATAQTPYKQLAAFSPDQILQYNLEPALSYDNNFELLANSNDGPLIRSFFEFYRQQALSSNNIEQVGIYCKRAFELYKHLDQDFQKTQRQTMLTLYEDYSWKWLLRNKIPQSAQVVADMNRNFGHSSEAVRAGAFTALLNNDLPSATRFFVNWLMEARGNNESGYSSYDEEEMLKKLRQLLDYDLLDESQLRYLCALFKDLTEADERLCPASAQPMTLPFDADTELRWKILVALYQANLTNRYSRQVQLLEPALSNAQTLLRRHPDSRLELEKVSIALANSYFAWGLAEQTSVRAVNLYQRVIQLLGSAGKFREEWNRQDLLMRAHLALGDYQLNINQLDAALATFSSGIKGANSPNSTSFDSPDLGILGNLYVQRGETELLLGKNEAARADFEAASEKLRDRFNPFYFGPISWMEGQTAEALTQYDAVFDESILAQARFTLQRLAEIRPETRVQMIALDSAMRASVRAKNPGIDTLLAAYQLSGFRLQHFAVQQKWATVIQENERALAYTERAMKWSKEWNGWPEKWLDAQLAESYYLLFVSGQDGKALNRAIHYSEQAETYVRDSFPTYPNAALLKTNHAHALLLRNGSGDRAQALNLYKEFISDYIGAGDAWELLQKDFRDLHAAGVQWPRLQELIQEIKPGDVQLSAEDWREMGVVQ